MFISRRKYEQDIKDAVEKAVCEVQQHQWQQEERRGLQEQINDLRKRLDKIDPPEAYQGCPCAGAKMLV